MTDSAADYRQLWIEAKARLSVIEDAARQLDWENVALALDLLDGLVAKVTSEDPEFQKMLDDMAARTAASPPEDLMQGRIRHLAEVLGQKDLTEDEIERRMTP